METKEKCCETDKCCDKDNGRCKCSVWKCIGWGVLGVLGFVAIAALMGLAIMLLWNWLIPSLFGLTTINFGQAIGLGVLARLLFGGCGGGIHRFHHRKWRHGHGGCRCGGRCKCGCACNCGDHGKCECKCDVEKEAQE